MISSNAGKLANPSELSTEKFIIFVELSKNLSCTLTSAVFLSLEEVKYHFN